MPSQPETIAERVGERCIKEIIWLDKDTLPVVLSDIKKHIAEAARLAWNAGIKEGREQALARETRK